MAAKYASDFHCFPFSIEARNNKCVCISSSLLSSCGDIHPPEYERNIVLCHVIQGSKRSYFEPGEPGLEDFDVKAKLTIMTFH